MTHKIMEMMAVHFQLQEVMEVKDFPNLEWKEVKVPENPGFKLDWKLAWNGWCCDEDEVDPMIPALAALDPTVLDVVIPGPLIKTEELGAEPMIPAASAPRALSAISVLNMNRDPDCVLTKQVVAVGES